MLLYDLGADELPPIPQVDLALTNTNAQAASFKKRLMEAAVTQAVAQMAASAAISTAFDGAAFLAASATTVGATALAAGASASSAAIAAGSVVPIIGWAFAAAVAIGTLIGGAVAKRQTKALIEDAKKKIADYGVQTQASIKAAQMQIASSEYPAAEALAFSNAPLDGLDGFKDWFTRTVAKAQVKSVQVVGKAILRTGRTGAELVGDKKGAEKAKKWEENWDANSKRVEKMFYQKMQNPYVMITRDLDAVGRTFSGQQAVHVVRQKCAELVAAAKRDMDTYRDHTIALMNTADYHDAVRTNIAKGLRGDPGFQARAQAQAAQAKMIDATFTSSAQVADTIAASTGEKKASSVGLLGTVAAAVGAFMFLRP